MRQSESNPLHCDSLHNTIVAMQPTSTLLAAALIEIYSRDTVPAIAGRVAKGLPRAFERADLEQIGRVALLEAAPRIDAYVRKRVDGAIRDSARFQRYRDATHARLPAIVIDARDPLSTLIDTEQQAGLRARVRAHVARLPADQARVVEARMRGRRAGRPRSADIAAEREATRSLREAMAA